MKIKVVFAAILLLFILAHPIHGSDSVEKEPDFYRYTFREEETDASAGLPESELQLFLDEIPSDIASQFGIDGDTGIRIRDQLLEEENVQIFFSAALDAVKKQLPPSLETLALILAVLVICAAFSAMKNSISVSAPGIVPVFDLCSALCIAMALYQTQMKLAQQTADCIERICTLINGALPCLRQHFSHVSPQTLLPGALMSAEHGLVDAHVVSSRKDGAQLEATTASQERQGS